MQRLPASDFHISTVFPPLLVALRAPNAPRLCCHSWRNPIAHICGGTGWRLVERVDANQKAERVVERKDARPRRRPPHSPKLTWAVPCDCTGGDRASRALARARIPRRYEHCDFENFDTDLWEGSPEAAAWNRSLAQATPAWWKAFARNYPAGSETGLLLMGPCGVGKTHLAVAALRQLMLRGHRVRFYDYRELLKEMQASYNPDHPVSEMGVLEPVLDAEVLLLDESGRQQAFALGARDHRPHSQQALQRQARHPAHHQLPRRHAKPAPAASACACPRAKPCPPRARNRSPTASASASVPASTRCAAPSRFPAPDYRREIRQAGRVRS